MAAVPGGTFTLLYPPADEPVSVVRAFDLDVHPVTNRSFLAFVRTHPRWRRDRIPRLFADPGYLATWEGPLALGPGVDPDAPVTDVSWFAARAYCEAQGKRLPTQREWEYAAAASAKSRDARRDPAFVRRLLGWYERPTPARLPKVMQGAPNVYGIFDLHGLVWEWVEDFGSDLAIADSRSSGDANANRFCGGGAIRASDKQDYAAFMRHAFRSSLRGQYTVRNLGFRCARGE